MLNILFVESYPQVIAGQQRTLMSLLEQADAFSARPTVLLPGDGMFADRLRSLGWATEVVPYPETLARYGGAIYHDGWGRRAAVARQTAGYVNGLRRWLKRQRPDAIYYNDMRGLLTVGVAAKWLGIPGIIWDKLDKPHGFLDWFQLPLVAQNPIISSPVATKYPAWQRRWYRDRITVVPNGVDFDRFQNVEPIRESLGYGAGDVVFGIVGTVTPRKGHDVLVAAFERIAREFPHAHLVVVGGWDDTPRDREFYESICRQSIPRVRFLGQRDEVPSIMRSIDALVIPSRHEGLGQVTLEAMACGKPVIGSKVGGIAETVVDGQTGWLFPSEDVDALTDAMRRVVTNPKLAAQLGNAGRERARHHYNRREKMQTVWKLACTVAGSDKSPNQIESI